MSLNETVSADRVHIGFFGRRNAGKSSLVNAVTGQSLAVVSDTPGTTTDPVKKAMELLPLGPVLITDTAGFDDEGELGELRVEKTRDVLSSTDIAVLVTDSPEGLDESESRFEKLIQERKIPYIIVRSKSDLYGNVPEDGRDGIRVSARTGEGIHELKEKLASFSGLIRGKDRRIIADLIKEGDTVILVTPIDESAPKGRIILPQQQTLRDLLDAHATAVVCQPEELAGTIEKIRPAAVVTDSQAFGKVAAAVPRDIPLTSFSILFARYKGSLKDQIKGVAALKALKDGDPVLVAEGCTHHRQCGDIGTVKLPALIRKTTGASPEFSFTSGGEFPKDLSRYRLILHCGACMLNEAAVTARMELAKEAGVPVVNYGIALAYMNGILERSLELLPEYLAMLGE